MYSIVCARIYVCIVIVKKKRKRNTTPLSSQEKEEGARRKGMLLFRPKQKSRAFTSPLSLSLFRHAHRWTKKEKKNPRPPRERKEEKGSPAADRIGGIHSSSRWSTRRRRGQGQGQGATTTTRRRSSTSLAVPRGPPPAGSSTGMVSTLRLSSRWLMFFYSSYRVVGFALQDPAGSRHLLRQMRPLQVGQG